MSKAWDLSCTCLQYGHNAYSCLFRVNTKTQETKVSADWLHDDDASDGVPEAIGYHVSEIPRGEYGESSKILEEVLELQDAEKQGAAIMGLHELSDIIGAVHGYLRKHYPTMKFEDLVKMANITRRAFEAGSRR